ncbi:MAG: tRNA (adenosine(37)-N6)-threonylcarbamoyltransferase complex transferase subunit TsaD [Candidatus Colwellbacteria bacterium]|nr:tRNA (adenosine(37)-N6)-threonylcarbamoyltransferase complex transferase subunit TsaD [Candidatus Colwellbacteria bacterium]
MRILAIETSCDETAIALVEGHGPLSNPRFKVLKSIISSQILVHRPFGGVVPNLAKREHLKNLPVVLDQILNTKYDIQDTDFIAVTVGPGLEPALWTGINFAKELAKKNKRPLLGANHLEGHLYSPLLSLKEKISLPAIGLVVSGGHTILLLLKNLENWKKIGETRDDAVGEAYDKVARLLGLSYPGGPEIERISRDVKPKIEFPRPMIHQKNYDFSFSGLKTSIFYYLREHPRASKKQVAASFQQAAIDVLVAKTMKAARNYKAKSILLAGGVAANKPLRQTLRQASRKQGLRFFVSDFKYSTDNAAMIGAAAYLSHLRGKKLRITAQANLNL